MNAERTQQTGVGAAASGTAQQQHPYKRRKAQPMNWRRFGSKLDAVALLQEWVCDVGSQAGLTSNNTQLHTGRQGAAHGHGTAQCFRTCVHTVD